MITLLMIPVNINDLLHTMLTFLKNTKMLQHHKFASISANAYKQNTNKKPEAQLA